MRLTIVNQQGGQSAMAMYPDDPYSILENLDACQIPYGSGNYRHLAVSPNGVPADELQETLAGVIENEAHPPSIRELNCLGKLIQQMTEEQRKLLAEEIQTVELPTVSDAYDAVQRIRPGEVKFEREELSERSIRLGEQDPYIRIQLLHDWENPGDTTAGIWVNCPASESQMEKLAQTAGVDSLDELQLNMMDGLLATSDIPLIEPGSHFQSFSAVNNLAIAMKEKQLLPEMGKFKAILYFESCMDFNEVAELAGKMDMYEFYRQPELECEFRAAGFSSIDSDALEELEIEETPYGFIRNQHDLCIADELSDRLSYGGLEM